MSAYIALTQRVDITRHGERRDAIDQRWYPLVESLGCTPLCLPNNPKLALTLIRRMQPIGVILTGGNDLLQCGGDAPERDSTEKRILEWSQDCGLAIVGVCRGMQLMVSQDDARFYQVDGHAGCRVNVRFGGVSRIVNSYHEWAVTVTSSVWETWGVSEDGVVKAVKHSRWPWLGVMWHPEREPTLSAFDRDYIFSLFFQSEHKLCVP